MPNIRWLLALITRLHRFVYRATNGRVGGRLSGMPMLLLTTVGRRTGAVRVIPLLYIENEGRWIVVASNAGDDRSPAWWLNLQARAEAEVQVGTERHQVKARRASPAEEAQLWPTLEAEYSHYADYRQRTRREIPVVILEPTS